MADESITVKNEAISLNFELKGALEVSRSLGLLTRDVDKAQKRAISTLRRKLPVQARRDIQAEYAIKAGRVKQDLTAFETSTGIKLRGYFRGIGLRNFGARDLRKSLGGVSYEIFRGIRRTRPHSFNTNLLKGKPKAGGNERTGNLHVSHRKGDPRVMKFGRYKGKVRQPIVTDYGPTVAQMLRKGRRPERLADFARGVLNDEMQRLLAYAIQGQGTP